MSSTETTSQVKRLLRGNCSGRVYQVFDHEVWVSGQNAHCAQVAREMRLLLQEHGIACGEIRDDDADHLGGVEFVYYD